MRGVGVVLRLDQRRGCGRHFVVESLGRGMCSGHSSMRGNLHDWGRDPGARADVVYNGKHTWACVSRLETGLERWQDAGRRSSQARAVRGRKV